MGRASKLAKCLATGREGRVGFETDDYGLGGRTRSQEVLRMLGSALDIGYCMLLLLLSVVLLVLLLFANAAHSLLLVHIHIHVHIYPHFRACFF